MFLGGVHPYYLTRAAGAFVKTVQTARPETDAKRR